MTQAPQPDHRDASISPVADVGVVDAVAPLWLNAYSERPRAGLRGNRLLAAFPQAEAQRWAAWCEPVALRYGEVLCEAGATATYLYFPTTAVVSLSQELENGASFEIAVVGNEGFVGVAAFMQGGSMTSRAVVRHAGHALRVTLSAVVGDLARPPVLPLFLRYTQALFAQTAQVAVCNRHHTLDQQLCRCLLLALDRVQGRELVMTQELMAGMLGVRRERVTASAARLQGSGLIRYTRGRIQVPDRASLEAHACACYSVIRREHDRLVPPFAPG